MSPDRAAEDIHCPVRLGDGVPGPKPPPRMVRRFRSWRALTLKSVVPKTNSFLVDVVIVARSGVGGVGGGEAGYAVVAIDIVEIKRGLVGAGGPDEIDAGAD